MACGLIIAIPGRTELARIKRARGRSRYRGAADFRMACRILARVHVQNVLSGDGGGCLLRVYLCVLAFALAGTGVVDKNQ